jgi:hypothetical protein
MARSAGVVWFMAAAGEGSLRQRVRRYGSGYAFRIPAY